MFRTFFSIEISDSIRERAKEVQHRLAEAGAEVTWTEPENLHVTLVFMGNTCEERIPALARELDAAAAALPAFSLELAGVGFFGPPRSPRIVWAGVAFPPPELARAWAAVADISTRAGVALDDKPFAPHLTLGRIRSRRNVAELTSRAAPLKSIPFGDLAVQRLLLMRSHLDEPRKRYSILHSSPLKGK